MHPGGGGQGHSGGGQKNDYVPHVSPTHAGPQRTAATMKQYIQKNSPKVVTQLHSTQHWHHHWHGAWVWGAYAFLPTANLVVGVPSGNMLTVSNGTGGNRTIRLAGVTAPSSNQAFFSKSQENLSRLANQHYVRIFQAGSDPDGAVLALVYLKDSGLFLNQQQIHDGMAMSSIDGTFTPSLMTAEDEAQEARVGIWEADSSVDSFPDE